MRYHLNCPKCDNGIKLIIVNSTKYKCNNCNGRFDLALYVSFDNSVNDRLLYDINNGKCYSVPNNWTGEPCQLLINDEDYKKFSKNDLKLLIKNGDILLKIDKENNIIGRFYINSSDELTLKTGPLFS